MSFFGSAKEFFGLGPVDNGEDDAYYDDPQYSSSSSGSTAYNRDRGDLRDRAEVSATPRPGRAERAEYRSEHRADHRSESRASYRTPSAPAHIVTAAPRTYNDAKEIGEPFRDGDAVVMDLTDLEAADAKRIVDFAAGLCFALRGNMHNLSRDANTRKRVFAIVPENATVGKDDLKRAAGLR